jgi:hypothetical protein
MKHPESLVYRTRGVVKGWKVGCELPPTPRALIPTPYVVRGVRPSISALVEVPGTATGRAAGASCRPGGGDRYRNRPRASHHQCS